MSQIPAIANLSGLTAYWPCDEASGATINDVTASPANATLSGAGGYLAPWNSPGGVGAVGLRPYSAANISIPATAKLDLGDNFTIGTFFRRRAAVSGTIFSRGTIYGSLGPELFADPGMEGALISGPTGGWSTTQGGGGGVIDTSVFQSGTQSYRIDVNAAGGIASISQGVPNAQPGRYTVTFWYRNDANTNGRANLRVEYVAASGGAIKILQQNTTDVWSTTSQDAVELPYTTTFTQYSFTFDLPEATGSGASSLKISFKRRPGAGGGVAYSAWIDTASLKYRATNAGTFAVRLGVDGVVSCTAGTGAEARTVATTNPSFPITDHLGWHYVVLTKSGATTKIYIDGVDRTVAGTDATITNTGQILTFFSGADYGLLPVVAGHMFLVNRALSSSEQAAIYSSANMLPDKAADPQIRTGFSQYGVAPNFALNFPNAAAAMRGAHATVVREMFPWSYIEPTQGTRTWTSYDNLINAYVAQGLSVYAVFEPSNPTWAASGHRIVPGSATKGISVADANNNATNGGLGANAYAIWRDRFTNFIVEFVNRYKDRVHIWEIGNEENSSVFWGPAASAPLFVDFYNYVRAAILAELGADAPNHQIVLGGFARHRSEQGTTDANSYTADEFLRALLDGGIGHIDRCAAHPYVSNNAGPYTHTIGGNNFDTLHQMRDTLMEYGKQPIVELNEHGWYTANSYVAAGSNGLTLPQSTIQVQDAAKFNTSDPTLWIETSLGFQAIGHTGISGNTLTGCTGGTGVISTGGRISFGNVPLTEATQAQYVADGIQVTRDYFSAFCDTYLYFCGFQHQINNRDAFSFNSAWLGTDFVTPKAMVATFAASSLPFERLQYAMGGNFTGSVAMGVNGTWKTVSDHKLSRAAAGSWNTVL